MKSPEDMAAELTDLRMTVERRRSRLSTVVAVLGSFVVLPMWFFLLYAALKGANVSDVTWFIFWAYMPVNIIFQLLSEQLKK